MRWVIPLGAILIVLLYATRLEYAPIYLHHDEVLNAVNAADIAATGRDASGRLFPLYFHVGGNYWATPIVAYTTAVALIVAPLSEVTIRMVSVIVGLIDIVLVFAIARWMFRRSSVAALAAVLLALTPAHFIHSRVAFDQIYQVVFVLAWLWCLARFFETGQLSPLAIGGLVLGIGLYTYLASLIMMPVYVVLTGIALYRAGQRSPRPYLAVLGGFLLPALLLVPWHLTHPAQLEQQFTMYAISGSGGRGALRSLLSLFSYTSLTERSGVFYQGFNPSMLFFSGGSSLINGTSRVGVLLLPIAVLLPVGIYHVITQRMTPFTMTLILGLLTAPLAGTLAGEVTVNRLLVILPFAILLSALGVDHLLQSPAASRRVAAGVLLVIVPVQFALFYRDYMGDYRLRSSQWYRNNVRGALEAVIAAEPFGSTTTIFLPEEEIEWVHAYWRFYLAKYGRQDLITRTVYSLPPEPSASPDRGRAVVIAEAGTSRKERLSSSGFREAEAIRGASGAPAFILFRR